MSLIGLIQVLTIIVVLHITATAIITKLVPAE